MSSAFQIAASGLRAQETLLHALAQDIANMSTPNYKASKVHFADMVVQGNAALSQRGEGSRVISVSQDFRNGPLIKGEQWNQVAIQGDGFFPVISKEGDIFYTRNSSWRVDEDAYLCTQEGLRLAEEILIPSDATEIRIQENGDVEAIVGEEKEVVLLGEIKLAKFPNIEALQNLGKGLYKSEEDNAILATPGSNGVGVLLQQYTEGSNVDIVQILSQLTMAQRVYQLNAKSVQMADEMEKMINEMHG